jgi:hypothetical protein
MLWDRDPKVQAQALRDLRWCGREFPVDAAVMLGEMLDAGEPSKQYSHIPPQPTDFTPSTPCQERECRAGGSWSFATSCLNKIPNRIHPSVWQLGRGRRCVQDCDGCLQPDAQNLNILTLRHSPLAGRTAHKRMMAVSGLAAVADGGSESTDGLGEQGEYVIVIRELAKRIEHPG